MPNEFLKDQINNTDSFINKETSELLNKLPHLSQISSSFKAVADTLPHHPAAIKKVAAEISREPFIYPLDSTGYYFSERGNVDVEITLAGIPVTAGYRYLHFSNPFFGETSNDFSLRFDKGNYLEQLKNKLKQNFNSEQLVQSLKNDVLETAKNKAIKFLQSDLNEIKQKYKGNLSGILAKAGNIKDLFNDDISTLTSRLLNAKYLEQIKLSQQKLGQLQERVNLGELVDAKLFDSLKNTLDVYKGINEVIQKIQEHKSKWLTTMLSENFKNLQSLNNKNLQQLINDPSRVEQLAREKLNLSGLQRFLLKSDRLDIGQNSISLTPLSLQNFMSTGINAEFFNKNKYFMIGAGQQSVSSSIWDRTFSNNIFNNAGKFLGVSFGKGTLSAGAYSRFSLFTYQGGNSMNASHGINEGQLEKSTVVATISYKILIGQRGTITTEISRSAMQYKNERNPLDSTLTNKTSLSSLLSSQNFGNSLAYSVAYSDEYPTIGLSHNIEIKSVANGYNNPGSYFLPSGTKEVNANIKKLFFKAKLQIAGKADLRQYQFNNAINKKWRNINYIIAAKWKFKMGQYLGLRYQPITMARLEDHQKYAVNSSERFSLDANFYSKISHGIYYRNYVNLELQKTTYLLNYSNINNKSFLITSQQSLVFKKNMLFWNTTYNQANNNAFFYFNTSLNSDAGLSYQVLKSFSVSTSLSYRYIKNWYTQAAIRQSITGQIGKKLSLNIYIDAGKNLKIFQPLPYSPIRAEWSLKYSFNNK